MPRPLKRGIIGAITIILSKDINKYAFMYGSNFYESDVTYFMTAPMKEKTRLTCVTPISKDSRNLF